MPNPRNLSRELRRARARIRYLEIENANLRSRLRLAPWPDAVGVYRGAPPVAGINRNSAHLPENTPPQPNADRK